MPTPDDEILFFNPEKYDKIIIVYSERPSKPEFGANRKKAISEHPLKNKIEFWAMTESEYWVDRTKGHEHQKNFLEICERLKKMDLSNAEITTHNAHGEYGHADHIQLFDAIMETVNCTVNGQDPVLYRAIKKVYIKNKVWTAPKGRGKGYQEI